VSENFIRCRTDRLVKRILWLMTDEMTLTSSRANLRLPTSIIAPKNVTVTASHNIHDIISSQEEEEEEAEEVVVVAVVAVAAVAECPTMAGHNDRRL
jgi:hypothetical protein